MLIRRTIVVFTMLIAGCIHAGSARAPGDVRDLSRIDSDELAQGHWSTADDIVRTLRPHWLATHGPDTIYGGASGVQVRMDDLWLGGAAALRTIGAIDLDSLRFIDPVNAAGRWGGNFRDGVILIFPRHGPRPDASSADTSAHRISKF